MSKNLPVGNRIMDVAWLRDGETVHTGEALVLAMLVHTRGKGRGSEDERFIRKLFKDHNLEEKKDKK